MPITQVQLVKGQAAFNPFTGILATWDVEGNNPTITSHRLPRGPKLVIQHYTNTGTMSINLGNKVLIKYTREDFPDIETEVGDYWAKGPRKESK
jgi:hypothetical protein